jgi:hypothetical protein
MNQAIYVRVSGQRNAAAWRVFEIEFRSLRDRVVRHGSTAAVRIAP